MRKALILSLSLLLGWAEPGRADLLNDDLAFFNEEASVTTVSRKQQSIWTSPLAVEVITREEIEASPAVDIWDLLRYRIGVDVVEGRNVEGNRAIASVRGFPKEFIDHVLVTVDGVSVYDQVYGGVLWGDLALSMQDIERIEIVRGPSAALYGTGAGLGVINFITRKPAKTSLSGKAFAGGRRRIGSSVSWEQKGDKAGYRATYQYSRQKGVPDNPDVKVFDGRDYENSNQIRVRGVAGGWAGGQLDFSADGIKSSRGLPLLFNRVSDFQSDSQMIRLTQATGQSSSLEVRGSRRAFRQEVDFAAPWPHGPRRANANPDLRDYQLEGELLHRFSWWDDRLHTTWGGSHVSVTAKSVQIFEGAPVQKNQIQRIFLHQTYDVSRRLSLLGAAALENSRRGGDGTEPAYQAGAVFNPSQTHAFRAGYGRSSTVPRLISIAYNYDIDGGFTVFKGKEDIKSRDIQSYDVGYQGLYFQQKLMLEANLYYLTMKDFSGIVFQSFNPATRRVTFAFRNINSAIGRGGELGLRYKFSRSRSVYANYTHEHITDNIRQVNAVRTTPAHKVNLGGVSPIWGPVSASMNAGYKGGYAIFSEAGRFTQEVRPFWRLDAKLSYRPVPDWEIFVSGLNLLRPLQVESADGFLVPRTVYGGLSAKFL